MRSTQKHAGVNGLRREEKRHFDILLWHNTTALVELLIEDYSQKSNVYGIWSAECSIPDTRERERVTLLQHCWTIILLNKHKLLKKPLFQKQLWSCDFLPRKTPVAQNHRAISRQEKMAFSIPVRSPWDSPPPPPESVQMDGRVGIRWRRNQNFSHR